VNKKNIQEQSTESSIEIDSSIAEAIESLLTNWHQPSESTAEKLRADTLDQLVAASLRPETKNLPLHRYLPAEISLRDGDEFDLLKVLMVFLELMPASSFEIIQAGHIEQGSLCIRFTLRTKSRKTKPEEHHESKEFLKKFLEGIAESLGEAVGKILITITLGTLLVHYGGPTADPASSEKKLQTAAEIKEIDPVEVFRQMVRPEKNISTLDNKHSSDK
jgi:hypothetical protein